MNLLYIILCCYRERHSRIYNRPKLHGNMCGNAQQSDAFYGVIHNRC